MVITHNGNILTNDGFVLNKIATSPSPSFLNQYSYNFDGVNDYVDTAITNTGTNDVSVSCWIKTTETFVYTETRCAFGGINNGSGANYTLGRLGSGFATPNDMQVRVYNTLGTTKLNDGNWHNIIYTHNYTTKETKAYVDGNTTPEAISTLAVWSTNFKITIGWNGQSLEFNGNVDECAYWENIISASDITSIYNSGAPNDLTSLNPVSWWRMGENATWRDPQWLLPSNENKDNYSNYSLDFDGVNDSISFITPKDIGETPQISYSVWVNLDVTTRQYLMGNWFSSNGGTGLSIATGDILIFQMADGTNDSYFNSRVASFSTYAPAGQWNHILATWDGTDSKIYINGVLRNTWTPTGGYTISGYITTGFKIGWRGQFAYSTNGKLDEIGVFNSAVSVGDVWDGSGKPIDISGVSGITNNWRMGDGATFDGTNWTIPDVVGSKDGTSANMDISDRVGDAPDSTNNALSLNMDEVDRETDVPT